MKPQFSICIPNYNYAHYLDQTLNSVHAQTFEAWECVMADNCSTDESVAVAQRVGGEKIRISVNHCNVGFAANLDKAATMARAPFLNMLSSDDLMRPDALHTYQEILSALGGESATTVLTSSMSVIDPDSNIQDEIPRSHALWPSGARDAKLSEIAGCDVYRVDAATLLRRALERMENPFNFASTVYSRTLYDGVEGYRGARLINPDKWFHWRLLGVATTAIYVDAPLFQYRWHPNNQSALQKKSGALKYLVDDYASVLELDSAVLERVGLSRDEVQEAFVEHAIARHGLGTLGRGEGDRAQRIHDFGCATFPREMKKNLKARALQGLLALGPVGRELGARAYRAKYKGGRGYRADG